MPDPEVASGDVAGLGWIECTGIADAVTDTWSDGLLEGTLSVGQYCAGTEEPHAVAVTAETVIHSPVMSCRRTGSGRGSVLGGKGHPGIAAERDVVDLDS